MHAPVTRLPRIPRPLLLALVLSLSACGPLPDSPTPAPTLPAPILAPTASATVARIAATAPTSATTPASPLPPTALMGTEPPFPRQTPLASPAPPTSTPARTAASPPTRAATAPPITVTATAAPLLRPTPPAATPLAPLSPTVTADFAAQVRLLSGRDLPAGSSVTVIAGEGATGVDGSRAWYAASTVKLPLYLTLAGAIAAGGAGFSWDTPLAVRREDVVGGTGSLQNRVGQTFTVRAVADIMLRESDNVAANLLFELLGGGRDREHLRAGAKRVTEYARGLPGIPAGIAVRHGLQDAEALASGDPNQINTVTTDALAALLRFVMEGANVPDGDRLRSLLAERGGHNPWHPDEPLPCGLAVYRIAGVYPAAGAMRGVRLDVLYVREPGGGTYTLAVAAPTQLADEPRGAEGRIARFEGDLHAARGNPWAQCVDARTVQ